MSKDGFYESLEWRQVRYQAIKANNGKCELCGRGKHDGVVLHVDHIEPRSKAPHLELDPRNLQVLCEDCNIGKGNACDTDWRQHNFASCMRIPSLPEFAADLSTVRYVDLNEDQQAQLRNLLKAKFDRDEVLSGGVH